MMKPEKARSTATFKALLSGLLFASMQVMAVSLEINTTLAPNDVIIAEHTDTQIEFLFAVNSSHELMLQETRLVGGDYTNNTPFAAAVSNMTVSLTDNAVGTDIPIGTELNIIVSIDGDNNNQPAFMTLIGASGGALAVAGSHALTDSDKIDGGLQGKGCREKLIWSLQTGSYVELTITDWTYANADPGGESNMSVTDHSNTWPSRNLAAPSGTITIDTNVTPRVALIGGGELVFTPETATDGNWNYDGAAFKGFSFSASSALPPANGYNAGMAPVLDAYKDSTDMAFINARLDELEIELGVNLLKVGSGIFRDETLQNNLFYNALYDRDFHYKALSSISGLNNVAIKSKIYNYEGTAVSVIDYWKNNIINLHKGNIDDWLVEVRASKHWEKVEYIVPELGNAHEPDYPYPGSGDNSLWCYGATANPHFRTWMQTVTYAGEADPLAAANAAWGTSFADWDSVEIPNPGSGSVEMWRDIIWWYRDSKRYFIEEIVKYWKTVSDKKLILYKPGGRVTEDLMEQAAQSKGYHPSITVINMPDEDFILNMAVKYDCVLQPTGLGRGGAQRMREYAVSHGFKGVMLGENAGNQSAGRAPIALECARKAGEVAGLDFHWNNWLYGDGTKPYPGSNDYTTKNRIFGQMKKAYDLVRELEKRPDLQPDLPPTVELLDTTSATPGTLIDVSTNLPSYIPAADIHQWAWEICAEEGFRKGLNAQGRFSGRWDFPTVGTAGGKAVWVCNAEGHTYFHGGIYDPAMGSEQTPTVEIVLEYYDDGAAGDTVQLQYDGQGDDNYKEHPDLLTTTGSGQFEIKRWIVGDAEFKNETSGADFRFKIDPAAATTFKIRSMAVRKISEYATGSYTEAATFTADSDGYPTVAPIVKMNGGDKVGYIADASWIRFDDFNYGDAFSTFEVYAALPSNAKGGTIRVIEDNSTSTTPNTTGTLLAEVAIDQPSANWDDFKLNAAPLLAWPTQQAGKSLFLYFNNPGMGGYLFDLKQFRFGGAPAAGADTGHIILASDYDVESNRTDTDADDGKADTAVNFIRPIEPGGNLVGDVVGLIKDGTWVKFDNFDFGGEANSLDVFVSCPASFKGGVLELWTGAPNAAAGGTNHCTIDVEPGLTADQDTYKQLRGRFSDMAGIHDLFLVFKNPSTGSSLFRVSSFRINARNQPTFFTSEEIGAPSDSGYTYATPTTGSVAMNVVGTNQTRFAYESLEGDFTFTAEIESLMAADEWSKAGIMVRESNSAGSDYLFHHLTTNNWDTAPKWLRIERSGGSFTTLQSTDGTVWTTVGSQTLGGIGQGTPVLVGLAVASESQESPTGALFRNARFNNYTPSSTTSYDDYAQTVDWGIADSSPTGDADGDRLSNLQEFAFATDPVSTNHAWPGLDLLVGSNATVGFIRRVNTDLDWNYQTSSNLIDWSSVTVPGISTNTIDATREQILWQYPTDEAQLFFRIDVTVP